MGFIVSLAVMLSCKKGDSSYDPDPDPGLTGTKLSKVIFRRLTNPQSADIYEYHYDNLNRITEITYSADGKNDYAMYQPGTQHWYYNGNEQLPYKSVGVLPDSNAQVYYFYDTNGRLISDSIIAYYCFCNDKYIHNWFNDKILNTELIVSKTAGDTIALRDSSTINNSNVTEIFTLHHPVDKGILGDYYSFDDKINPLNTLNIHAALPFITKGGIPTMGYNKNNVTEHIFGYFPAYGRSGPFTKSFTSTYTYRYNNANLPIVCEESGDGSLPIRIKFYYTD